MVVGCLWFGTLIGVDPLPHRAGYPMRVISAFLTLPFHAWLGVVIMSTNTLIAGDWYTSLVATGVPVRSPTSARPAGSSGSAAT